MRILSSMKMILFLSLFVPIIVYGQATLKGIVVDTSSNEPLIGVNVTIQGTSIGAATDIDGKFLIFGIPERAFDVKISCVGYEPLITNIDFSKSQNVSRKFQLKPTVIQGEEVVVTAQMKGQLAAINQQITSNSIVNVVSEEKIQELPDANAAEAIGRLPGVALTRSGGEATGVVLRGLSSKFSNITIDGVKIPPTDPNSRDVDLSMISQGTLAGIELYKTLTPDQDADAIAGGINLVTRKAPSEMLLQTDVKGSYNYLMKSANQYDASARYGERFFNDILGVRLEGNVEKKIRSQENVATSYNTTDNPDLPTYGTYNIEEYDNDYSIKASTRQFTNEMRKRNGMQAALDVNTPDSGSVKLTGIYAFTNRNYMTYERQYSGTWIYDYQNVDQNMVTRNGSLQGKNYLLGLTIDWNGSYAESKVTNPTNFRTIFYGAGNSNPPNPIKENPEQFDAGANNDFTKVALDSMDTYKTENFDKELTGQFGLTKSVTFWDVFSNEIKVGVKYKEKSRWLDNDGMAWNTYQDAPFLDAQGHPIDFSGTPFAGTNSHVKLSDFVDMANIPTRTLLGTYTLSPLIDVGKYQMFQNMVQNSIFTAQINYGDIGAMALSNYFITERISSAYLMDNISIGGSIAMEFGVRMERERNDYLAHYGTNGAAGTGNVITINPASVVDTSTTYEKTLWFPNLQLTLRPTDFLTLRFAAYQAVARPDFSWRLPQLDVTKTGAPGGGGHGGTYTNITVGNPQLADATANNFETGVQIFGNNLGLLTVSAYYKRIDNLFQQINAAKVEWPANNPNQTMIVNGVQVPLSDAGYHRLDDLIPQFQLSEWLNTPAFANLLHNDINFSITAPYSSPNPSYAWGFELEHQLNFRFLPVKWLQNFTLTYNIQIARSETYFFMEKAVVDTQFNAAQYNAKGKLTQDSSYTSYLDHTVILVKKPMEDQPQLYGNAALGYDIGGFSARISVFYQGRYTRLYSVDGTSDAIVGEFIKWDLALKEQVTQKISLVLNIDNLFNKPETRYRYNNMFNWGYLPTQSYLYGRTLDFGVRVLL